MKIVTAIYALTCLIGGGCTPAEKNEHISELRLNLIEDPNSLDPRQVRILRNLTLVKQLYEGLMRLDSEGKPTLAAAESYELSDDLLTYTFHLRKAFWTNGDPVTAEDFAASWRQALDPAFPCDYAYMLYPIKNSKQVKTGTAPLNTLGITVRDPQTLVVTLEAPTPYFLELTAFPTFFPINTKTTSFNGDEIITNGPFRLVHWQHDEALTFAKSESYWDAEAVKLKTLTFMICPDSLTETYLFEKGMLDWLGQPISQAITPEARDAFAKVGKVASYPVAGTFWLSFNTEKPPFDIPELRRAFSYALSRKEIIEHVLRGGQQAATSPLPPSMELQATPYFEDGNTALALQLFESTLAQKGWTRETMPKITLNYLSNERTNKIVQLIQQQWQKTFNMEIPLIGQEREVIRSTCKNGKFVIATGEWVADFNDPLSFLEIFKLKNDAGWQNEKFNVLLDLSSAEKDPQTRHALLQKAVQILVDEMPVAPLYHYSFDYAKRDGVQGVVLLPIGIADFKYARIAS